MAKTTIPKANEALLLALACGATQETAAQKSEISRRTVIRRLEDPKFRKRLNALRADMVQRATGMLTAATLEAVKTLLALQAPVTPPSSRLGAARTIIELGLKLREETDLVERFAALEKRMEQQSKQR
jgi:hypothetical protein